MSTASKIRTKTPCIGVCSTGIGDSVCRGCKRFAHEVINWNAYSEEERGHIIERLHALLTQVMQARIEIVDQPRLNQQLAAHKVRCQPQLNPHCQAFEAIRTFGSQLLSLDKIGCRAYPEWQHLSVAELKRSIDQDLYRLSCAHYERYFPGHM